MRRISANSALLFSPLLGGCAAAAAAVRLVMLSTLALSVCDAAALDAAGVKRARAGNDDVDLARCVAAAVAAQSRSSGEKSSAELAEIC